MPRKSFWCWITMAWMLGSGGFARRFLRTVDAQCQLYYWWFQDVIFVVWRGHVNKQYSQLCRSQKKTWSTSKKQQNKSRAKRCICFPSVFFNTFDFQRPRKSSATWFWWTPCCGPIPAAQWPCTSRTPPSSCPTSPRRRVSSGVVLGHKKRCQKTRSWLGFVGWNVDLHIYMVCLVTFG